MIANPSVPTDILLPHIVYEDVAQAIDWLSRTFGFLEHYRYAGDDGRPAGAQMHLGNAWIMLRRARPGSATPAQLGASTQSLTIFVPDVDAHFSHSQCEGATIVEPLNLTHYGERQYAALDLAGHHWLFSQHAASVDPTSWGATVAHP